MPIFVCENCQNIENTALSDYWARLTQHKPKLCSQCGLGKWHGQFPEEKFDPKKWKRNEYNNDFIERIL